MCVQITTAYAEDRIAPVDRWPHGHAAGALLCLLRSRQGPLAVAARGACAGAPVSASFSAEEFVGEREVRANSLVGAGLVVVFDGGHEVGM